MFWTVPDPEDPEKTLGGHTVAEIHIDGNWAYVDPMNGMYCQKPDGSLASWVAFGPDGNPRAYVDSSLEGPGSVGTGGGAVYLTSGATDFAVVLSALGKVYVREWDAGDETWSR